MQPFVKFIVRAVIFSAFFEAFTSIVSNVFLKDFNEEDDLDVFFDAYGEPNDVYCERKKNIMTT